MVNKARIKSCLTAAGKKKARGVGLIVIGRDGGRLRFASGPSGSHPAGKASEAVRTKRNSVRVPDSTLAINKYETLCARILERYMGSVPV